MKAFALIASLLMGGLAQASDCIVSPQCAFVDEYIRELREVKKFRMMVGRKSRRPRIPWSRWPITSIRVAP